LCERLWIARPCRKKFGAEWIFFGAEKISFRAEKISFGAKIFSARAQGFWGRLEAEKRGSPGRGGREKSFYFGSGGFFG
jgi:hypothetical protein